MNLTPLHDKLKQASIHRLILETGQPTQTDWYRLGKALDRRFKLVDRLLASVKRGHLSEQDLLSHLPGLVIIRQIEEELSQYQEELAGLADDLASGDISETEFEQRLEAITAAILILAFLSGRGGDEPLAEALRLSALMVLESGGVDTAILDLSVLPTEAIKQLEAEIEIAQEAGAGLAAEILAGRYDENEAGLLSRLAMWATTAAGVYALGQLLKSDDPYLMWNRSLLKDSCTTCLALDGVVRRASDWAKTSYYPQARNGSLACGGWRCGCFWTTVDGPEKGSLP